VLQRIALFGGCLLLAASALAQSAVTLRFPAAGERAVWVGPHPLASLPADPDVAKGLEVAVPVNRAQRTHRLYVWDRAAGNLAAFPVADLPEAQLQVRPEDFRLIAQVEVRVESAGQPVSAAQVRLGDGARTHERLIDPSSEGVARFVAVAPGEAKVTVNYVREGEPADPVTQIFPLPLERPAPVTSLTVSVPGPVATLEPPGAAEPAAEAPPAPTRNPIGGFLVYLLALAGALGLGFLVMKFFKDNPDRVTPHLERLGVQIPKPEDAEPDDPPPVAVPSQPAPPEKIMLGDAAPSPVPPVAASTLVASPRLVSEGGERIDIPDGELPVGRDEPLGGGIQGETTVSRRHAVLVRTADRVAVRDEGSTNGTFVNGVRIEAETPLRPGDQVQFGSVRLRYEE
jgi:hypothetical protein